MSKKNAFAQYIESNNIDTETAARHLKVSRAYVHLLIRSATTPSLKLASVIEAWSKGVVTMQAWIIRRGRPPGKKNAPKEAKAKVIKEAKKTNGKKVDVIVPVIVDYDDNHEDVDDLIDVE